MPDELFTPNGVLFSPLRETHALLMPLLAERRGQPFDAFTETTAKEIFPHWLEQLEDAREELGTL